MSSKYQVLPSFSSPDGTLEAEIILADSPDYPIVSWREAKKQLRAYYLNKAASLRSVTEKDYFNNA